MEYSNKIYASLDKLSAMDKNSLDEFIKKLNPIEIMAVKVFLDLAQDNKKIDNESMINTIISLTGDQKVVESLVYKIAKSHLLSVPVYDSTTKLPNFEQLLYAFKAKLLEKKEDEIVCVFLNKAGDKFNVSCVDIRKINTDIEFLKARFITYKKFNDLALESDGIADKKMMDLKPEYIKFSKKEENQYLEKRDSLRKDIQKKIDINQDLSNLIIAEDNVLISPQLKNIDATIEKINNCKDKKELPMLFDILQWQIRRHEKYLRIQNKVYPKQIEFFQNKIDTANKIREELNKKYPHLMIPYVGRHTLENEPVFEDLLRDVIAPYSDAESILQTEKALKSENHKLKMDLLFTKREVFFKYVMRELDKYKEGKCTLETARNLCRHCPFDEIEGKEIKSWGGTEWHIGSLINLLPELRKLDISDTDYSLTGIEKLPGGLKELNCAGNQAIKSETLVKLIRDSKLEALDLSRMYFGPAPGSFPKTLKVLSLRDNKALWVKDNMDPQFGNIQGWFYNVLKELPNLVGLDIGATTLAIGISLRMDGNLIELKLPKQLKVFSCAGNPLITNSTLNKGISDCVNLIYLNLSGNAILTLEGVTFPKSLENLRLQKCKNIENVHLANAIQYCKNLQILNVLTDRVETKLKKLDIPLPDTMKVLSADSCSTQTISSCHNLVKLIIKSSEKDFLENIEFQKSLKVLYYYDAFTTYKKSFEKSLKNCSLEYLYSNAPIEIMRKSQPLAKISTDFFTPYFHNTISNEWENYKNSLLIA